MDYRDEVYFHSRPEKEPAFPAEEFAARRSRVKANMQRHGIDLLLVMSPENMYYLSGYQAMWYQAQSPRQWPASSAIAVHLDHDRHIHFDSEREAVLGRIFAVSDDVRFFPRHSYRDGSQFIVEELKAAGWLTGVVGLEFASYRPNRLISQRFEALFEAAGATVADGTDVIREVRWVKSEAEMACLEEAARIANLGMAAARSAIRPDATELEVYGEIVRATTAAGGEPAAMPIAVLSGTKTNALHGCATRRRMGEGDLVLVDLCGVFKRYHINLARTFSIGEPARQVAEKARKAAASMDVIAALLRPNLPVRELNEAVKRYFMEAGLWESRGWVGGYEMGIAFPPDWVGNFVYDPLSDINADRLFEPGTAVNYENQFFMPGHVGQHFTVSSLLFTQSEAKILSDLPFDLIVAG